jgi:3D (Asp-Asp-Asp) domain-containing protein
VLAFPAAALALMLAAGASGADPGGLSKLRARASSLSSRYEQSLLGLYSIETRLQRAQTDLADVQEQIRRLEADRAITRTELRVARRALALSQRRLGDHARQLYESGSSDPLAILFGSRSLDDAVTGLDDLRRAARMNSRLIDEARTARARALEVDHALDARRERLRRLEATAQANVQAAAEAEGARSAYLGQLLNQQQLTRGQISALQARAAAAGNASVPQPSATPVQSWANGARTVLVTATGYDLPGTTSTGIPVGWGVVAVDPNVIPLGTRMTIPGYGEGVAADVGSAIQGPMIDLWFPSPAAAGAWGKRVVTITLHR